ncbi:RNA polymerase sigma factor SigM [Nocardioides sp. TF02-7]|uniref:RNA polymerase sigma factor SigM n=1 Tax=Nocardioides sp. TF02-7 TaxID=2917724 RepID=UPI001F059E5A|nr:RNA polymerase sigma factor SigM [Nocardioides sp. TF02-7]UMG94758.1 RNA polymerase sigma factor SigM [Nocardioides sp. TF02-7]
MTVHDGQPPEQSGPADQSEQSEPAEPSRAPEEPEAPEEPAAPAEERPIPTVAELPTEAGMPVWDDEDDEVSWLRRRSTPPPPPPPFEDPPERPLFAPEPADGAPARRPRTDIPTPPAHSGETSIAAAGFWPWDTGAGPYGPQDATTEHDPVPGRSWLRLAMAIAAALALLVAVVVAFNLGRGRTPARAGAGRAQPGRHAGDAAGALADAGARPAGDGVRPARHRRRGGERRRRTARRRRRPGDDLVDVAVRRPARADGTRPQVGGRRRPRPRRGPRGRPGRPHARRRAHHRAAAPSPTRHRPRRRPRTRQRRRPRPAPRSSSTRPPAATPRPPATSSCGSLPCRRSPAVTGVGWRRWWCVGAEPRDPRGADRDDAALLAAHVAGDPDAFGVLFERHRDRLWAVALRTTGDPETAADGLQDGLVAAFRRAGSFRGDSAVTTWLHRVVVNACLDRLRAQKVRRAEPLPDDLDEAGRGSTVTATGPSDAERDPAEHGARAERRREVLAALAQLPAEQRAALVLVDMEGYPVAEVAVMLDCAEGTVKSRCARGRAKLAALLAPLLAAEDAAAAPPAGRNPKGGPDVGSVSRRGPPTGPAPDPV